MKITDKIRIKLIKALIKADCGFTYTGIINGVPVQFYCQRSTGKYLLGMKKDSIYYWEPGQDGWIAYAAKDLPWGEKVKKSMFNVKSDSDDEYMIFPEEPVEVSFIDWVVGVGGFFGMGLFMDHAPVKQDEIETESTAVVEDSVNDEVNQVETVSEEKNEEV